MAWWRRHGGRPTAWTPMARVVIGEAAAATTTEVATTAATMATTIAGDEREDEETVSKCKKLKVSGVHTQGALGLLAFAFSASRFLVSLPPCRNSGGERWRGLSCSGFVSQGDAEFRTRCFLCVQSRRVVYVQGRKDVMPLCLGLGRTRRVLSVEVSVRDNVL